MRKLIAVVGLTVSAGLVTLPALPTVHAAPRAAAPAMLTSLSIMVGGLAKQIYLPSELSQQLGFFKKEGLNVTLIDEPSGQSSEDATIAGQVQAGSGAYQHTIELQTLGKGLETVVQLGIAPGEAEMVATKEAGTVKSFKDLRGKNLGVTELGSGTHALSKYLLIKAGVPETAVHFIPVGAADTFIAAMQQGTIDAGMTTEPTISRLLSTGEGKVLVDLRTPKTTRKALGTDFPFISVFMSTSYVNSHKSVVQHVVNAYVRTLHWIHTHTATQIANKLPADYYAGNKGLYVSALKAQQAMFSPTGLMPKAGPATVLKLERATNTQVGTNAVNLSKTYTNAYVAKAMQLLHIK
ncbi:MAG TPA: ABC transporter substrate-binding protein [Chloroflexota bacterium]